ncbi:hypothetical protein ElyMa_006368800 [Elysia marginata]|uniref:G-protein coupled receptors family 1 profile domain-containing protein n=1 Tax=Elysia marginata TaxID=1093978 RepID=A0AAV4HMS4_9GAST|nr:hypothetical protein ElyMa_006368800 [Elysia marginata]
MGDPFFGLVAIRLASLNQTLNPWLYVILRRALIIRIKRMCCRWRKLLRKKTRPRQRHTPAVGGRRHQYVHVRNQLCHRNLFVGEEPDSLSLTDSMRKSLQRAMPGAMSLPDVMMLDTGRGGEQLPLPDIAKAQSFAGRVSHGTGRSVDDTGCYQGDSHTDCPYCCQAVYPIVPINFVSDSDCSECIRDREMMAARAEQLRLNKSVPASRKFTTSQPDAETTSPQNGFVAGGGEYDEGEKQNAFVCDIHKADPNAVNFKEGGETPHSPVPGERIASITSDVVSRHTSYCHKHADEASRSSIKGDVKKDHQEPLNVSSKSSSITRDLKSLKNSNSSSSRSSDVPPYKGHRKLPGDSPRNSWSLRSSSGSSSVKAKLPLQQSNSLDVPTKDSRSTSPVDFNSRRVKSHAGSTYAAVDDQDNNGNNDDDSDKSDSMDDGQTGILPSNLRTETTTDDYGFSSMPSMPTESVLISEQTPDIKSVSKKPVKDSPGFKNKSFLGRFGGGGSGKSAPSKTQDVVSGLPPRAARKSNKTPAQPSAKPVKTNSLDLEENGRKNSQHLEGEKLKGNLQRSPTVRSPSLPSSDGSPTETRKESDATSGIFSDESPSPADRRDGRGKPPLQKEAFSDTRPTSRSNDK